MTHASMMQSKRSSGEEGTDAAMGLHSHLGEHHVLGSTAGIALAFQLSGGPVKGTMRLSSVKI